MVLNNRYGLRVHGTEIVVGSFASIFGSSNYKGDATIMLWVKPLSLTSSDSFAFSDDNFNESFVAFRQDQIWARWTHNAGQIVYNHNVEIGKWYHVAVTHWSVGNSRYLRFYVDGEFINQSVVNTTDSAYGGDGNLKLANNLHGEIDELRVWNRVLSDEEIRKNMLYVLEEEDYPNLRVYWKFDEEDGEIINHAPNVDEFSVSLIDGVELVDAEIPLRTKLLVEVKEPKEIILPRETDAQVCLKITSPRVPTLTRNYELEKVDGISEGFLFKGSFDVSQWIEVGDVRLSRPLEDTITKDSVINSYARINTINDRTVTISRTVGGIYGDFELGDKVMVHVSGGTDLEYVGRYDFFRIVGINNRTITLDKNLDHVITQSQLNGRVVQIVKVPEMVRLTVPLGVTLYPAPFDGECGGIFAVDVKREFNLQGKIDASQRGYRDVDRDISPNNGEWAVNYRNAENGAGGGGNQFRGGDGAPDDGSRESYGGRSVGSSEEIDLNNKLYFGGAGGKGGETRSNSGHWNIGTGGAGGGIVYIEARTLILGEISANGGGGRPLSSTQQQGGSGGGAGGSIKLVCNSILNMKDFSLGATGGGGASGQHNSNELTHGRDGTNQSAGQGGWYSTEDVTSFSGRYYGRGGYPYEANAGGGGGSSQQPTTTKTGEDATATEAGKAVDSTHIGGGGGGGGGHIIIHSNLYNYSTIYPRPYTTDREFPLIEEEKIIIRIGEGFYIYNKINNEWEFISNQLPSASVFKLRGMGSIYEVPINDLIGEDFEVYVWSATDLPVYLRVKGLPSVTYVYSIRGISGTGYYWESDPAEGDKDTCIIVPKDIFTDLETREFEVRVATETGEIFTDRVKITLVNNPPRVSLFMEGYRLTVEIKDDENDPFTYSVKLNGETIVPLSGVGEELVGEGESVFYRRMFDSSYFNIGEMNVVEVIATDKWGAKTTETALFVGDYYGLMFADEYGEYYSTDLGEVLKKLIIDPVVAGNISNIYKVRLINKQPFPVKDVRLWLNYYEEVPNTLLKFSKTEVPFMMEDELNYEGILEPEEEVEFFVRLFTVRGAKGKGKFNVIARAFPVTD